MDEGTETVSRVRDRLATVFRRYGWALAFDDAVQHVSRLDADIWTDVESTLTAWRSARDLGNLRLEFLDLAGAEISLADRTVRIFPLVPDLSPDTREHFALDVLLPRLIAETGALVLHGALLSHGGDGICLLGRSGRGKSTLSAALRRAGWTLHGDDALALCAGGSGFTAQATYPSLRLFPDSLEALFPDPPADTSPVADYLDKFRLDPSGLEHPTAPVRLRAVFVLDEEDLSTEVTARPLAPSKSCMSIISNAFSLYPPDPAGARRRLLTASAITASVPGYALSYPRDYARLPEVIDLLRSVVDRGTVPGAASGPPSAPSTSRGDPT